MLIPERPNFYKNRVIITDGLIGGGKALLAQLVSSIPKVEMWIHNPKIEGLCASQYLSSIDLKVSENFLKLWIDEDIDNIAMMRNMNFRFNDLSSVTKYPRKLDYLKRLLSEGGRESLNKFIEENRVMHYMTHSMSAYSKPLFETLNERLIYLRLVRNPMTDYMINHLAKWCERWGKDFRSGVTLIKFEEKYFPFFAKDKIPEYSELSSHEKAIFLLKLWQEEGDHQIDLFKSKYNSFILEIPFESLVFQPMKYINKIAEEIGVTVDKVTKKQLKLQNVPRKSLSDAPFNKVYFDRGWRKSKKILSLEEEIEISRKKISNYVSVDSLECLDELSNKYLNRYKLSS